MDTWQYRKQWSDRFITEIKTSIAPHIIGEAPIDDDQLRNTDLVVVRAEPVRIACRVRRPSFLERYPFEFTIRSKLPNRTKTELHKIVEGWGDYLFYGHADYSEKRLRAWMLCDLRVFRLWFSRGLHRSRGQLPGIEKRNSDGCSSFRAFDIRQLPPEFIIAKQGHTQ